jgi:hypothetical protein
MDVCRPRVSGSAGDHARHGRTLDHAGDKAAEISTDIAVATPHETVMPPARFEPALREVCNSCSRPGDSRPIVGLPSRVKTSSVARRSCRTFRAAQGNRCLGRMTTTKPHWHEDTPTLDLLECLFDYAGGYFRLRNFAQATRRGYERGLASWQPSDHSSATWRKPDAFRPALSEAFPDLSRKRKCPGSSLRPNTAGSGRPRQPTLEVGRLWTSSCKRVSACPRPRP